MYFWQRICYEARQAFLIDKRRALFLFGAALAYLFLFGFLYVPGVVKHVPLVIYDEDQTAFSREIVRGFTDSESFSIVQFADSEEEMKHLLHEKKALAAIEIPQTFSSDLKVNGQGTVLFIVNGANIILTNTTSGAVQDLVTHFSDAFAVHQAAQSLGMEEGLLKNKIDPVHCTLRVLNNPTQSYLLFFVLGLAMAAFQQGIFLAVGASAYDGLQEKGEKGCPLFIFWTKIIFYWVMAMGAFSLVVFAAASFWHIPEKASWSQLLILAGAFSLAVISLCFFGAAFLRDELQFVRISISYTVPAFIFSGYTWPQESLSHGLQLFSYLFPLAWLSNAVRDLFLMGSTRHFLLNVGVLLGMGVVFLFLGQFFYLRRLGKKEKTMTISL